MNQISSTIERKTYTAPEVAKYLGISRAGAYNLMHAVDFPSFWVGKRLLVTKAAFEKWVEDQGKTSA